MPLLENVALVENDGLSGDPSPVAYFVPLIREKDLLKNLFMGNVTKTDHVG
jgi:hypothetical protein